MAAVGGGPVGTNPSDVRVVKSPEDHAHSRNLKNQIDTMSTKLGLSEAAG